MGDRAPCKVIKEASQMPKCQNVLIAGEKTLKREKVP